MKKAVLLIFSLGLLVACSDKKEIGSGLSSSYIIEETRDAGGSIIDSFGIPPGNEVEAVEQLLNLISPSVEVSLMNDDDEGGEGTTRDGGGARGLEFDGAIGEVHDAGAVAFERPNA